MKTAMRYLLIGACILFSCSARQKEEVVQQPVVPVIKVAKPVLVTDTVTYDSDDPAFWINPDNPAESLVLGTDKGGDTGDGAIFVFDLKGKIIQEKTVHNIKRPNNIDVAYGLMVNGKKTDIAVCTERYTNSIRVFSLPDMKSIDGEGIPVFENDSLRAPMGVALYTDPSGNIYAIVSRKTGP